MWGKVYGTMLGDLTLVRKVLEDLSEEVTHELTVFRRKRVF